MIKVVFLVSISLLSSNVFSQSIRINPDLPAELKMLVNCLPLEIPKEDLTETIRSFNSSVSYIAPSNLKIFTKTEIYRFIVNFDFEKEKSKLPINKRLKELFLKKRRLCNFEQWILYSIKTDLSKIKESKNNGYKRKLSEYSESWISFLENKVNDAEFDSRVYYLNFLKNFSMKAKVFTLSGKKFDRKYLSLKMDRKVKETPEKKEVLDKIFKENLKKDN